MKSREELLTIWESRENGNISTFNDEVRDMTKLDCLNMIECVTGQLGIPRHRIINSMRTPLERDAEEATHKRCDD